MIIPATDNLQAPSLPISYQLRPARLIPTWSFCFVIFSFFCFFFVLSFKKKKREKGEGAEITPFSSLLFSSLLITYPHRILLSSPTLLSPVHLLPVTPLHCIAPHDTLSILFRSRLRPSSRYIPSCSPAVTFLRSHDAGIWGGLLRTGLLVRFFFLCLFLFSLFSFFLISLGLSVRLIHFCAGK